MFRIKSDVKHNVGRDGNVKSVGTFILLHRGGANVKLVVLVLVAWPVNIAFERLGRDIPVDVIWAMFDAIPITQGAITQDFQLNFRAVELCKAIPSFNIE
ncbi:hypothetical protein [Massilia scottii]|uniref:hypothetical protein n=1 Tax=Massilia scottii TaxID=3057166 RepID=UPI0027969BA3|nr:hypothetical protein [Massilia sp. CCM 9029]MDQ1835593.1 hypothetical protein [Massilia sp. CCM 9029]